MLENRRNMEQLIEILKELHPDVDYENCTTLITDKILVQFGHDYDYRRGA